MRKLQNPAFLMKYKALKDIFVGCIDCADDIRAISKCLTLTTLVTCEQIFRRPADFGQIFARCARQQILDQIFENPEKGQVTPGSAETHTPPGAPPPGAGISRRASGLINGLQPPWPPTRRERRARTARHGSGPIPPANLPRQIRRAGRRDHIGAHAN